jgi:RIO kinase 1
MKPEITLVRKLIREQSARTVFAKVFDQNTIETLHSMASKGLFQQLEFVIKTGKEGHVFRAVDKSGNYRAVKIYKVAVTDFKNMFPYIKGDTRFAKVKNDRRSIVHAWVQKEFKNLRLLKQAGVRVPSPMGFKNNVLVMEFIGEAGEASTPVKSDIPKDMEAFHDFMRDSFAKMVYKAKLVHADLSEYNILNKGEEFVIIDVGQGVLLTHPKAREFLDRDVHNVCRFLSKKGFSIDSNELLAEIKAKNPTNH